MNLEEEIKYLRAKNAELLQSQKALEEKVLLLLQIIEQQSIKKDSHNSHNPPSSDKTRPKKNQSLRKKTGRQSGGQPGHKGHTLEMSASPDKTEDLKSNYCQKCGEDLSELNHLLISKRQEIILPPIIPQYVEYRQYGCECPCGHHQKGIYPNHIKAPIQFGSSVVALVSYFNVFQYVPYARLKLLFKDVFNLSMSEGSIKNLLTKGTQKADPIYQTIFAEIKAASYLGADETGAKVNGEKWWIWVWQNAKNTFLKASKSRGFIFMIWKSLLIIMLPKGQFVILKSNKKIQVNLNLGRIPFVPKRTKN